MIIVLVMEILKIYYDNNIMNDKQTWKEDKINENRNEISR